MPEQNKPLLLNDLETRLDISDEDDLPLQSSCTIYRVPPQLQRVNQLAHTPNVVSIGPYHHGDSRLESMQELKLWYFKKFLKRIKKNPFNVLFEAVKKKEDEIRSCYSEYINMESDYFVRLIMFDASFIIEFLYANCDAESKDDPWSTTKPWISYVMLDLVLLENQIPFLVLEILSNLATFPNMECEINSFVQFAVASYFIKHIYPDEEQLPMDIIRSFHKKASSQIDSTTWSFTSRPCHFCDLLRKIYGSRSLYPKSNKVMKCSYGASQLQDVGFKFEVVHNKSIIDLDCYIGKRPVLKIERPVLKIPSMKITCWTEIILRNIFAFEQCHYPFERFVTDYIILLDCLINTEKDVEILVEKRIMHTLVDNDKVAAMVNTLSSNVSVTHMGRCYADVHQMFNKFYGNPCCRNKATFVRDYWSTPWKKLSLIGGIVLLVLTFIQTICSIISLIKQ